MLEELEELAWFYGLHPSETGDLSPYELLCYVQAQHKRDQQQATFLHTHALLCRSAMDGDVPEVWEAFPLWTRAEINQRKVERIQARMMKNAKFAQAEKEVVN